MWNNIYINDIFSNVWNNDINFIEHIRPYQLHKNYQFACNKIISACGWLLRGQGSSKMCNNEYASQNLNCVWGIGAHFLVTSHIGATDMFVVVIFTYACVNHLTTIITTNIPLHLPFDLLRKYFRENIFLSLWAFNISRWKTVHLHQTDRMPITLSK